MPHPVGIFDVGYGIVILLISVATGLSCAAILSQAVRTSPLREWKGNFNALIIGGSYTIVLVASLLFCVKRRVAVRMRLHRISKVYSNVGRGDVPAPVHEYIAREYFRACLVFYGSLPKDTTHPGWGTLGTNQTGDEQPLHFRREILDMIPKIDELAHIVIPTHPTFKPHARMLHHFRFILPLLPSDEDRLTPLHYFDAAVQIVRTSSRELTQREYELGKSAAEEIISSLNECRLEMEGIAL